MGSLHLTCLLLWCGYLYPLVALAASLDAAQLAPSDDATGEMRIAHLQTLLAMTPAALANWPEAEGKAIKYSSVPGYFLQDDPATDASKFDYAEHNLGLIDRSYSTDKNYNSDGSKTQWQRFARWVSYLNKSCRKDSTVRYKVLVMGRHGQGYHNAAESYYGTPAWNCYWAELDGNGTSVWADPQLTPQGITEAAKASAFYRTRYEELGMPYFESYYSSPLTRCIQTAHRTFANLSLPATAAPFAPVIKELFRESVSIHTCDRRSSKTHIRGIAPQCTFEDGFTEEDELWRGTEGETSAGQKARNKVVLDDVFTHDANTWISITSHSGEIASLLDVLGHRKFGLQTGQIIPVLVKAEIVDAPTTTSSIVSFTPEATCNSPPVTSIAGQGCICTASATPTPQ
ncbi:Histidine phosphatase superfamily, clade-1 [Cordyceps fumosorosea ARSEF 2679]|uniref:Histidine phosphatase superfamily, clade-1 n=1 Tax=Cordyceps fumosorosea (strain ARSEF 2679) TaxID=1081104 RepID=A0A167PLK8_CORFA|nr:Histidine phosphatase superfamily, clade-1 [Cordyceps fumosorosea ARSEF 2679]OAA56786.1 Histidine phosphatase superfamily, clade-1 [Cordyceps fumosorosea ARSEF 2679]